MKLDATDYKLLRILQTNAKQSIKQMAAQLNLSIAPVHERIKKLEKAAIIQKYVAILNLDSIRPSFVNYCSVSLSNHNKDAFIEFEKAILKLEQVQECYYVTGNNDYLIKVITKDVEEYQDFIMNKLAALKVISNINSQMVMNTVKHTTKVAL